MSRSTLGNLECIGHLHGAGNPSRHEPWLGGNDYRVIIDAIDKAHCSGVLGFEYFPTLDPIESLSLAKRIYL